MGSMTENIADKAINDTRIVKQFTNPVKEPIDSDINLFDLLDNRAKRDPEGAMIEYKGDDGTWHPYSAQVFRDMVIDLAKGLVGLGVNKGDSVAIVSRTRWEWTALDMAIMSIGALTVPVYETNSASQVSWIFNDSKVTLAIAEDDGQRDKIESVRDEVPTLRNVFVIEAGGLNAIKTYGESVTDAEFWEYKEASHGDDRATIVYTSGSTGTPKGVELTHRNFAFLVLSALQYMPRAGAWPNRRLLLFLPLAHCFARYIQYVCIGGCGVVGYIPDAKRLLADIRSFKPTYLLGVPRVFEKVYNAASQKAGAGIQGHIFAQSVKHFVKWSKDEQAGRGHSFIERMRHSFYMATVGKSIRSALGPNLKWLACGGAPLNVDLAHFFNGMNDITFIQGYGMTETAAPMLVNWEDDNEIGSVGKPGPGMGVRLGEDDEIELTGPNVFLGYYKQPELTAQTMTADGWIKTGDLGRIDDRGFTFITGRKKDIIITAGGKNISPAPMEDVIDTCPIVAHAVVVGDGKPFVSALIELDPEMLHSWLEGQGLNADMTLAEASDNDAVRAFIQQYIDQANANVSRAESVRKFAVLDEEFSQEHGTLTPSMKVVRPKVLQRYATVIEEDLYAPKPSNKPLPATAKIIDSTLETVKKSSESVKQASEQVKQASEQMKTSVSDSIASVSEKIKKSKAEPEEGETGDSADNAADTGSKPDQPADEKNEE